MHREELLRRLDRAGLLDYERALGIVQGNPGRPAEEILISSGLVTEAALARLIAEAYRVPFMTLLDQYVSPDVARLVPRDVAENYSLLPVEREGDVLTVAMADPLDLMAEDLVRFMTSCQIRRVMVPRSELMSALTAAYDGTPWPRDESVEAEPEAVEIRAEGSSETETVASGRATSLVLDGIREGATDVHFEPREAGLSVRFRIDGVLQKAMELGPDARAAIMAELRRLAGFSPGDSGRPRLGRLTLRSVDTEVELAVSSVPSLFGQKVVLRVLDRARQVPELDRLGFLPDTYRRAVSLLEKPSGLLVVAGPGGSGRVDTVYGMLHHLEPSGKSLVALEDTWLPDLSSVTCIPVGDEPGALSFRTALEGALLQDPDVILIRRLPDRETADLALRAASEALVITCLTADSAVGALQGLHRLVSSPAQATSALLGVVAQRRVRRLCERCLEEVPAQATRRMHIPADLKVPERHFVGRGCKECHYTGYRDRVGLQEVLLVGDRLRDLLWNGSPASRLAEVARSEGMVPLLQDGLVKVGMGLTTLEEVLRALPPDPGSERGCPTCGKELAEGFQVCPYCDPGLDRLCPSCRKPAQSDWRTCPYCRWTLAATGDVMETQEDLPAVGTSSGEAEVKPVPGFRTVLVADHDATSRATILQALERAGYEVMLADDGVDAVERIQHDRPDLILADVRLPRVDGLEILRRTRAEGMATPVLLMHPEPDADLQERVRQAGGAGVLSRAEGASGWLRRIVRALQEQSVDVEP